MGWFKVWMVTLISLIVLGTTAFMLYLVQGYLRIVGIFVMVLLCSLCVLAFVYALNFVMRAILKIEAHDIGRHGTILMWLFQLRTFGPMDVRDVPSINHVGIGSLLSPRPPQIGPPEPEEIVEEPYDDSSTQDLTDNIVPMYSNLEKAREAYRNGYTSQGRLAKSIGVTRHEAIKLIAVIESEAQGDNIPTQRVSDLRKNSS